MLSMQGSEDLASKHEKRNRADGKPFVEVSKHDRHSFRESNSDIFICAFRINRGQLLRKRISSSWS